MGKTCLLEEATAEAKRRGALVVWGHCLDGHGMPLMWPWAQAIGAVLDGLPTAGREERLSGELGRFVDPCDNYSATSALPDNAAQFRLFERAVAVIGQASTQRAVVLVIDDLQWTDVASLRLFGHVAIRLPRGTVVIGALRDRAVAARMSWHRRVRLGPLGAA